MKLFNLITTFLGLAAALLTGLKLVPSTESHSIQGIEKRAKACMLKCQGAADDLQDCNYRPSCQGGTYWWRELNNAYNNCCRGAKLTRSENVAIDAVHLDSNTAGDPAGSPADYVDPTGGKVEGVQYQEGVESELMEV